MWRVFATLVIFLFVAEYSFTQSQATSGNIEGRVVDQNHDIISGISVALTNRATGFTRSTRTDGEGNYIFVLVPPGYYEVATAAGQGFAVFAYENAEVTVGATITKDFQLIPSAIRSVIDVSTTGNAIETARSSISSTVDQSRIVDRPSIGRSFLDFLTAVPGITRDPVRGGDLAVGGQKSSISLQVDGASSDNTFFGQTTARLGVRAGFQFSVDAVREFQVNQNGYSAEFGRTGGAVVNVVTRSGTNKVSGSGFWFLRNDGLDANSTNVKLTQSLQSLPNARNRGTRNQFGGSVGGPIIKDRLFVFGAYEGAVGNGTNFVVLNSLLTAPLAVQSFLRSKTLPYPISFRQGTFLLRSDLYIGKRDQLWARLNQMNFRGINMASSGILVSREHTGNRDFLTSTIVANWSRAISANWFNELRFQYSHDKEPGYANSSDPEVVLRAPAGDTFLFGRSNANPNETTVNHREFADNQTFVAGEHRIKFGAGLLLDDIFNFDSSLFAGSFTFSGYDRLNSQLLNPGFQFASGYRQSFAGSGTTGPETFPDNEEYAFFLQDEWRVNSKLTANIGVRYDFQDIRKPRIQNPDPALRSAGFDTSFRPSDKNNIAPRFGLAYAFDGKTVIRGGYGVFFGRTPGMMTAGAHSRNGIQLISISINCDVTPSACPIYPAVFSSLPTTVEVVKPDLYLFGRSYRQPFTHQASVQFERELFANSTVSVLYSIYRGDDLTRSRDANLARPVPFVIPVYDGRSPTGRSLTFQRFPGARPIPKFGQIDVFESTANSFYQGLTFEFNHRFTEWWQLNSSYTLSRAQDDKPDQSSILVDGGATLAENQFDLSGEYGRSDLDVRHRLIVSPIIRTAKFPTNSTVLRALFSNYLLAGIFTAQTGTPYSALVSGDPNNDGNAATDRVPGTRRNEFSTRAKFIIDLRLGRTFGFGERLHLTFLAEAFNLLNRSNVLTANNTLYQFGTPSAGLPARLALTASTFGAPRTFLAASQASNASASSYNREIQLGVRFEF